MMGIKLHVSQTNQVLVVVVDAGIVEGNWVALQVRVRRLGSHDTERNDGLDGQMGKKTVLTEQPQVGEPKARVVLLWRLGSNLADRAYVRAVRLVRGHCVAEVDVQVEPQMVRVKPSPIERPRPGAWDCFNPLKHPRKTTARSGGGRSSRLRVGADAFQTPTTPLRLAARVLRRPACRAREDAARVIWWALA